MAMMAMTTNSSMSVNPRLQFPLRPRHLRKAFGFLMSSDLFWKARAELGFCNLAGAVIERDMARFSAKPKLDCPRLKVQVALAELVRRAKHLGECVGCREDF